MAELRQALDDIVDHATLITDSPAARRWTEAVGIDLALIFARA